MLVERSLSYVCKDRDAYVAEIKLSNELIAEVIAEERFWKASLNWFRRKL